MSEEARRAIQAVIAAAAAAHERFAHTDLTAVSDAAGEILRCLQAGGTVLTFGNGGSAGDAQHFAAELVGRFENERAGLAAMSLAADISVLTSIGNDYGYEVVFKRQVEAMGRRGDVAIGISTSGRSQNVVLALEAARSRGMVTVALTGHDGGPVGAAADIHINVAEASTARVQEVHRTVLHAICSLLDAPVIRSDADPRGRE